MLDSASAAQTTVQTQIVEQLEQQLHKVGRQTNRQDTFIIYLEFCHECTLMCLTKKVIVMSHLGMCL